MRSGAGDGPASAGESEAAEHLLHLGATFPASRIGVAHAAELFKDLPAFPASEFVDGHASSESKRIAE